MIKIHPEVISFNIFRANRRFTQNRKFQPQGGARGIVRGSPISLRFIASGPRMSAQNLTEINQIDF